MSTTLSIIIPVYKVEDYLERCVNSVLNQDYRDLEVILVDDGSPDKCPQICDSFAFQDSRIKVIHKPNGGLSDARNVGLKAATGGYVIFLDSDDYYNNNKFLYNIEQLLSRINADAIFFKRISFEDGTDNFKYPNPYTSGLLDLKDKGLLIKAMSSQGVLDANASMKVLKRSVLLDNELFFKKGIVSEDVEWFMRLVPSLKSIALTNEIAYCYRVRKGSISHSISYKNINDLFSTVENYSDSLEKMDDKNTKEGLMEYLSYQYFIVLGYVSKYLKGDDYKSMITRMKKYTWILKYSQSAKTRLCKFLVSIIGLKSTSFFLGKYLTLINR